MYYHATEQQTDGEVMSQIQNVLIPATAIDADNAYVLQTNAGQLLTDKDGLPFPAYTKGNPGFQFGTQGGDFTVAVVPGSRSVDPDTLQASISVYIGNAGEQIAAGYPVLVEVIP